jgi:RND family efflux transporter MFP subunit
MKRRRFYWAFGVVIILAIAGVVYTKVKANQQSKTTTTLRTGTVQLGEVMSTISGSGTVQSQQNASVVWQTNGTVQSVSAVVGQLVQSGDELATLDPGTLPTSVLQARIDVIDATQALEELKKPQPFKIAQAKSAVEQAKQSLEDMLHPAESAIAQARVTVISAQVNVETAQAAVDRLQYERGSADSIATSQAAYVVAQAEVMRLEGMYAQVGGDPSEDPAKAQALSALEAAKSKRNQALATLNWYKGDRSESEIETTLNDLAVAQGNLADAQQLLERLLNPPEVDIALAQATLDDAEDTLDALLAGPTESDLMVAETRLILAEAAEAQATLTAPFTGKITSLDIMPGDIVNAGTTALRMDDLSKLYVTLSISELDISLIKVGQDATLTFDAITGLEYHGKVIQISMAASVSQGVVNYPVTVQITDPDESILPSMTAFVNIIVAKAENVLVVPNSALRTTNGQRSVTLLFEGQEITIPVTVGLVGDSTSEVLSEQLREGDTVVLSGSSTIASGGGNTGGQIEFVGPGGSGSFESIMP